MGNVGCANKACSARGEKHANKTTHEFVASGSNYNTHKGAVHMLVCALDYKLTKNPLTSCMDAKNVAQLAQACNVASLRILTDEQEPLRKEVAEQAIIETLQLCRPDDFFVFYYSGHGTQLKDTDGANGDELDDEAYCFQDEHGQITYSSCMTDDTFAEVLSKNVPKGVQMIVLSDCCHSDTIADLGKPFWGNKKVISISGCQDNQTSGDAGNGGIFTHSLLLAIDKLGQARQHGIMHDPDYSVGFIFNATIQEKESRFKKASQKISIEHSKAVTTDGMCWPLVPLGPYASPLNRMARSLPPAGRDWNDPASHEHAPGHHGVQHHVLQHLDDAGNCTTITAQFMQLLQEELDEDRGRW
eukprot:TRINITY_DN16888_c0_g1_i1.p1 TRINITY_DN16888_c0_g1~~TRINITY_DN16888_c0_g1_i1.p1  ORF type:complete len:358 (+),score=61.75 TRINITY_DN16888_c0_g1_i1:137-1210(+)